MSSQLREQAAVYLGTAMAKFAEVGSIAGLQPQDMNHRGVGAPRTTLGIKVRGLDIVTITAGSPAYSCRQLEIGDKITAVDGVDVVTEADLTRAMVGCDVADTSVVLSIVRAGQAERFVVLTRASHTTADRGARLHSLLTELVEAADSRDDLREIAAEIVSLHGAANITNYDREFERRKQVQSIVEAGKMTLEHAEMAVRRMGAGGEDVGDGDSDMSLQLQEAQSSLRRALSEREALAHQLNDVLDRVQGSAMKEAEIEMLRMQERQRAATLQKELDIARKELQQATLVTERSNLGNDQSVWYDEKKQLMERIHELRGDLETEKRNLTKAVALVDEERSRRMDALSKMEAIAEKERVLEAEWGQERASLSAALSNEKGRLKLVEGELEDVRKAVHEKGLRLIQLEKEREERQKLSHDERAVTEEMTRLINVERAKKDAIKAEARDVEERLVTQRKQLERELEAAATKLQASELANKDFAERLSSMEDVLMDAKSHIEKMEKNTSLGNRGMDSLLTAIEGTCTRVENFTISSLRRHIERNEIYVAPLETDIRRTKRELIDAQDMVKKVHTELAEERRNGMKNIQASEERFNVQISTLEAEVKHAVMRESEAKRSSDQHEKRCGELKAKVLELEKEIVEGDVGSTREIEALKVALGRANEETKELEAKLCAAEVEIVQLRTDKREEKEKGVLLRAAIADANAKLDGEVDGDVKEGGDAAAAAAAAVADDEGGNHLLEEVEKTRAELGEARASISLLKDSEARLWAELKQLKGQGVGAAVDGKRQEMSSDHTLIISELQARVESLTMALTSSQAPARSPSAALGPLSPLSKSPSSPKTRENLPALPPAERVFRTPSSGHEGTQDFMPAIREISPCITEDSSGSPCEEISPGTPGKASGGQGLATGTSPPPPPAPAPALPSGIADAHSEKVHGDDGAGAGAKMDVASYPLHDPMSSKAQVQQWQAPAGGSSMEPQPPQQPASGGTFVPAAPADSNNPAGSPPQSPIRGLAPSWKAGGGGGGGDGGAPAASAPDQIPQREPRFSGYVPPSALIQKAQTTAETAGHAGQTDATVDANDSAPMVTSMSDAISVLTGAGSAKRIERSKTPPPPLLGVATANNNNNNNNNSSSNGRRAAPEAHVQPGYGRAGGSSGSAPIHKGVTSIEIDEPPSSSHARASVTPAIAEFKSNQIKSPRTPTRPPRSPESAAKLPADSRQENLVVSPRPISAGATSSSAGGGIEAQKSSQKPARVLQDSATEIELWGGKQAKQEGDSQRAPSPRPSSPRVMYPPEGAGGGSGRPTTPRVVPHRNHKEKSEQGAVAEYAGTPGVEHSPGGTLMRHDWSGGTGAGVGILLGRHSNGVVSVKGVDAGAPGYGKVDKGDVIVAVDEMECHGKSLQEICQLFIGPVGSKIHLTIKRGGSSDHGASEVVTLTRQIVRPNVKERVKEGGAQRSLEFSETQAGAS